MTPRVASRWLACLIATAGVLWLAGLVVAADAVALHHPPLGARVLAALVVVAGAVAACRAAAEFVAGVSSTRRLEAEVRRRRAPGHEVGSDVVVFCDSRPLAACVGLWRPEVVVSTGAIASLSPAALAAVVQHERHHAAVRDPLRAIVLRAVRAGAGGRGPIARLVDRERLRSELAADECAELRGPGVSALASALLAADTWPSGGIEPARVDRIAGAVIDLAPPRRDLVGIAVGAAIVLATLGGIVLATGCGTGPNCDGHIHPAAIGAVSAASALCLLAPRRPGW